MNFRIDLDFEANESESVSLKFEGKLQGQTEDEEWRTLRTFSVDSETKAGDF